MTASELRNSGNRDAASFPDTASRSSIVAAALPVISIPDIFLTEGDGGTTFLRFPVTTSDPVTRPIAFDYRTANGSAVAGSDYVAQSGTLTIPVGGTEATIAIAVEGDRTVERDESFTVTLSNPVNATIGNATGTGFILNDDAATAVDDIFASSAVAVLNGDVTLNDSGDVAPVTAINGNAAAIGQSFRLSSGALVTMNASGTFSYDSDGAFGYPYNSTSAVDSFTYTLAGGSTARVTVNLTDTGASFGSSTSITGTIGNDVIGGSARNEIFYLSSGGDDRVNGGAGSDYFYLGAALGANDRINGGSGTDYLVLAGNYSGNNAVVFNATTVVNVENIRLEGGGPYDITIDDTTVAPGQNLSILDLTSNDLRFDGSAEKDGNITIQSQSRSILIGGDGNDNFASGDRDDQLFGGAGNDSLYAAGGDDLLDGGDGNDFLDGGIGADLMRGGAGNDSYVVDNAGDRIVELVGGGRDYVFARTSYALEAGVEIERIDAQTNLPNDVINLTGNEFDNILSGHGGVNRLDGGAGNDTLIGYGGADTLIGGTGNDIFVVDNTAQQIVEFAGEGYDSVLAQTSWVLAAGVSVENLQTFDPNGTQAINLTGNELDNIIQGNAGANVLSGGMGNDTFYGKLGADTMLGGLGNDTFVVDDGRQRVMENAGEGTDTVRAQVSYSLTPGQEVEILEAWNLAGTIPLTLNGNEFANIIRGNAGNNSLSGGGGADTLIGGGGNDVYAIDNAAQRVVEAIGGGSDFVLTRVSYTLEAGQEIERIDAARRELPDAIDLTGNEFDNILSGNVGVNVLNGGGGNDTLIGYGGADTLIGGTGNDVFVVDNAAQVVIERAGGGFDSVLAQASYTLAAGQEIENLQTFNPAGFGAINLTGNEFANLIQGNAADNILTGGGGDDRLVGGAGLDTASFSGAGSGYALRSVNGFLQVVDTNLADGNDGTDTLIGIEQLRFADGTVVDVTASSLLDQLTGGALVPLA